MMDIYEIRHRNVRMLVERLERESGKTGVRAGGMAMLSARLNKSSAQTNHFASLSPVKNIGDKTARDIEAAFGYEYGWMDWPQWEDHHKSFTESRPVRLDRDIVRDVAEVLEEQFERLKLGRYDFCSKPELFTLLYELGVAAGHVKAPDNMVRLGMMIEGTQGGGGNVRSTEEPDGDASEGDARHNHSAPGA